MRRLPAIAAVVALAAACTEPTRAPLSVLIQGDTIAATLTTAGEITWVQFTIPATAHNFGITPVVLGECSVGLDRRVGGEWQDAWNPSCQLTSAFPLEIPPGQTRTFTVDVVAAVSGPGFPRWTIDEIEGTYRLGMWIGSAPVTEVASNTFVVVRLD